MFIPSFKKAFVSRMMFFVYLMLMFAVNDALAKDRRAYQHGVRFVTDTNGQNWLLWSSSEGSPPKGETKIKLRDGSRCTYFTHDIFISEVDPEDLELQARVLLSMPEAQEPVDVAIADNGTVAISYEDGSESDLTTCSGAIKQRYQIFSQFPDSLEGMQTVHVNGAHSGHIASVGNKFVIAYAEGWIYGNGVSQYGTANDIYLDVISENGKKLGHKAIAIDNGWPRDWW